jgi:hypothetical protein
MRDRVRLVAAMLLIASMTLFTVPARAADSAAQDAAYGAGSVFTTLLYAPLKTSFCIVGGVTSALTLPFGGTDTAGKVATTACGGTWLITPDALKGKERVRFMGETKR